MNLLCKRGLALVLAAMLCMSMMPVSALAEEIIIEMEEAAPETVPQQTESVLKDEAADTEESITEMENVSDLVQDLENVLRGSVRVTYCLGVDLSNKVYWEQELATGSDLEQPEPPVREGYEFLGWYMDKECTIPWDFSADTVTEDIILYAKWGSASTQLDLTRDSWHITNSPQYFDGNYSYGSGVNCGYEMTHADYKALVNGMNTVDKVNLFFERRYTWGGSCFGLASAVVLHKEGKIRISNFPESNGTRYNTLAEADLIRNTREEDVGNIESMINYYFMRQFIGEVGEIAQDYAHPYYGTDSENIRNLINKMRSANAPVMVDILLIDTYYDEIAGGHAVVGYDLETTSSGYTFKIYDNAFSGEYYFPVTVTVSGNTYTASCPEWEQAWEYDVYFTSCLDADDLQLHPILTAPGVASGGSTNYYTYRPTAYALVTTYGDFTITDGSKTAVVTKGRFVSGDLDVTFKGQTNEIGNDQEFTYEIPALTQGKTYTITQNTPGESTTRVINTHPSTGFFAAQKAESAGTITVSFDGTITTSYDKEVEQLLYTALNSSETPWYVVELEGESAGFVLSPEKEEVGVLSETDTSVKIRAMSDFSDVTLSEVEVGSQEILIREGSNQNLVVELEEQLRQDVSAGYTDPESGLRVEISESTYNGRALKPQITVWDGDKQLTEGSDYTLGWRNNVKAADAAAAKAPQVIIRGRNAYKQVNLTVPFTIRQADLKDLEVTVPGSVSTKSGNRMQQVAVSVRTEYIRLSAGNYTVRYYTDEAMTNQVKGITTAGTYYLQVEAKSGTNITGTSNPIRVDVK